MKTFKQFVVMLVIAALAAIPLGKVAVVGTGIAAVVVMDGCATDTRAKWAQGQTTLTSARAAIGMAHDAGLITDEQLVEVANPIEKAARGALDAADAERIAGNEESFAVWMKVFEGAIDQLLIMAAQ